VPFSQLRIFGFLADGRVLDKGIAEVVHHRRDGEDSAQPLIETFLLRVRYIRSRHCRQRGCRYRKPPTMLLLVTKVEIACAIVASLWLALLGPLILHLLGPAYSDQVNPFSRRQSVPKNQVCLQEPILLRSIRLRPSRQCSPTASWERHQEAVDEFHLTREKPRASVRIPRHGTTVTLRPKRDA
jgi:hypothetical protein